MRFAVQSFRTDGQSMEPNFQTDEYVLVNKVAYLIQQPQRGDVIIFHYPLDIHKDFIKRLIGLPGDEIIVQNGQLSVNGKIWSLTSFPEEMFSDEETFNYFTEQADNVKPHTIRLFSSYTHAGSEEKKITVPPHSYFVMGDNRDQSHDSRFWGFVADGLLVGQASLVWLSCEETLVSAPFICDPFHLRLQRFFKTIN